MSGVPPDVWGFALGAAQQDRHQLERAHIQSAGDGDEFHDVELAFAAFVFGDKRLRFLQATGEGMRPFGSSYNPRAL